MILKLQTKITAIFDHTIDYLVILSCGAVAFIMLSISTDVVTRRFLGLPIGWVVEISEILLPALVFLSAAWILKREGHTTMDVVVNMLSPRGQALLNTVTSIIGVIICLVLVWYGAKVTWNHFQRGVYSLMILELPTFPRYAVISTGCFLLSIQFLRRSYRYLKSWRALASDEKRDRATANLNQGGNKPWNGG